MPQELCDILIKNQLDMSLVLLSLLSVLSEVLNDKGFTVIIVLFVRGQFVIIHVCPD